MKWIVEHFDILKVSLFSACHSAYGQTNVGLSHFPAVLIAG
jgi:hypothetical protein